MAVRFLVQPYSAKHYAKFYSIAKPQNGNVCAHINMAGGGGSAEPRARVARRHTTREVSGGNFAISVLEIVIAAAPPPS